ncbi:hypothetical protein BDK92_5526 [Micromonospora pisi]|uniref:WD40 repeat protein n=1 Tax=Micromonospora pisi TaxID=589240 RepID=A0A495JR73_9ACTN|nr:hypothetical protein [Micromonospora pisi]RKR91135.1 hypothetical protein BDK92_5526 [Micromonospora pisi]
MLRVGILVTALLGSTATASYAAPPNQRPAVSTAVVTTVARAEPTEVCTIGDDRLVEISGLATTDDGYVAVNDSADLESRRKIFFLDQRCRVTRTVSYPSLPRDTEDMAVARDGTIWIADIGDNDRDRTTVGFWRLAKGAKSPVPYRFSYPDGPHDAEALLLDGDGTPIIVTKDPGLPRLYTPEQPPRAGATVPLRKVGQFNLPVTRTSNPWSALGRLVVTGGATAPDGSRVVLRTYADAIEFDVTDGKVAEAVTTGTPRITPLPDEPQGESITYSRDGDSFLTVSETVDQPSSTKATILRYTPTPRSAPSTEASEPPATSTTPPGEATPSATARADDAAAEQEDMVGIARLIVGIGIALLVLGTIAVVAILVTGRRSPRHPR